MTQRFRWILLFALALAAAPLQAREPWAVEEEGFWGEYVHAFRVTKVENPDHQYAFLAPRIGWALPHSDKLSLVLEPHLGYFFQVRQAWMAGANGLLDWRPFRPMGRFLPFFEIGAGFLLTDYSKLYGFVNFELQAGLGVHCRLSDALNLSAGWRFHHISNGGLYLPNVGINGHMATLGVTWLR